MIGPRLLKVDNQRQPVSILSVLELNRKETARELKKLNGHVGVAGVE